MTVLFVCRACGQRPRDCDNCAGRGVIGCDCLDDAHGPDEISARMRKFTVESSGILWVAPADTDPADSTSATRALPATYLNAGVVELPAGADRMDQPTRLNLLELTAASLDLAQHGGRRHLLVDFVDGPGRIRWHLPDAAVTTKSLSMLPWACTIGIDVDPATASCVVDQPHLV